MYLGEYSIGDTVKYRANFHNDQGTLEDPTSPAGRMENPDGTFADLATPSKIDAKTGQYGGSISTVGFTQEGIYFIRLSGTVTAAKTQAKEFAFRLKTDATKTIGFTTAAKAEIRTEVQGYMQSAQVERTVVPAYTDSLESKMNDLWQIIFGDQQVSDSGLQTILRSDGATARSSRTWSSASGVRKVGHFA